MTTKLSPIQRTPPEPTLDAPYIQLDWLCARFVRRYKNELSKKSYFNAVNAYKHFLERETGYDERLVKNPRFYLSVHCDSFVLCHAAQYWRERGLTTHTIHSRLQCLRQLLNFAAAEKLTPTAIFLFPHLGKKRRETLIQEAYEAKELELIWSTFAPIFDHSKRIAAGYKPTGKGTDPRLKSNKHPNGKRRKGIKRGEALWTWENFVWYFENEMHCQPLISNREAYTKHGVFLSAGTKHYGSIREVWRRLGVAPVVDHRLIVPLAMKLCWETGLNVSSLLGLKRDCLQESHPLTGLPYLRYYKERSTGEKHLHLNLFDPPGYYQVPLLSKQSTIIRQTIQLILKITEPLVSKARKHDKDFLFLYQYLKNSNDNYLGGVVRLYKGTTIYNFAAPLLQKLRKSGHKHVPTHLNLTRFRPSRIAQMVREGKDFFAIQTIAGHANVSTTMRYLSKHQIDPQARRELSVVLKHIHDNEEEFKQAPKPYATQQTQRSKNVIYKGVFCDCKNVYDPPKSVRRLPSYRKDQPCTYFNMCLSCPNILITKKHLPLLIRYKQEIALSIRANNLSDVPNAVHYEKTLAILDGILLEFDEADVTWALEVAECANPYIDQVTYRAVEDES